jgi:hypothetical protein
MRVHTKLRALSVGELESLLRRLMITEIKMKEENREDQVKETVEDESWIWKREE